MLGVRARPASRGLRGGSVKLAPARASFHPPLPSGESVYPPPACFRHLIGCRCCGSGPLLLARVSHERNHCAGRRGGGEAGVGTVLPEAQRRSVWPRAPAQRGRKRALETGAGCRPRLLDCDGGGSAPGSHRLKGKTSPICYRHSWGLGRSRGRSGWFVGGRRVFSKNRRELQS
ncbi:PREDICTED: LOW QUALITY PROTEIN: putative uncharacterized protein FLJ46541 [Mandrillus leucophaeus]|uniref:LOW QUALITY PROTEIN: putative uncharacterized protein FLJ46541 n=1 Tax=Mandrillus leucophaeus TaxID=9568 RepID=UPI0005F42386|nr:PREDICTED: LOW QUALITY PROTEIN: putative uncharacterized protein FLJ46541 [Mandrillus leucophaeus]